MGIKVKSPRQAELSANKTIDSQQQETETIEELKRKLYIDAVLGCFNRNKFEEDLKNFEGILTYFSIDANNLKYINDTLGHDSGDLLLKVVAQAGMAIWGDDFFRIGGDEFGVLMRGIQQDGDTCLSQINDFKALIAEENKKTPEIPLSVAAGFAVGSTEQDFKIILDSADEVMYLDKAAYKEAHPEYDMRRARLTQEAIREAIADGTFNEVIREYRKKKGASGVSAPMEEVNMEFTEGIIEEDGETAAKTKKNGEWLPIVQDDEAMDSFDITSTEEDYRKNELTKEIQPILHKTTSEAVQKAVQYQNDKLKLEVNEVLQDELGYRLSKYEKRRRRRDLKERIGFIARGVFVFLVVIFILGNAQLRLRFALITKDLGDMFSALMRGGQATSNKLVEDMFRDLGDDLNDVNTIENGFDIEDATEGAR